MFSIIIITAIISSCVSLPTEDKETGKLKDCVHGILNPTCLKIGAITLIEKLNAKNEVSLFPGVSLVKEGDLDSGKFDIVAADVARSLTGKGDERLDKYLLYHVGNFLDTHSLKFKLLDNGAVEDAVEVGRKTGGLGGGGKKGGMGGIMAMAMMMKGTLMSVGMGALALLAGKALMTAMMSLLLSAIIGIKSISSGQKSTTYEIVSKPIYTHSHSHSTAHEDVGGGYAHGGYGRSLKNRR